MNISVVTVGFALVVLARIILGFLRANYLKQASESVSIDPSKEIVLRYALWYLVYPIGCFAISGFCAFDVFEHSNNQAREIIGVICALFMFFGGLFLIYQQISGRVKLFEGKLTYTEISDHWEVSANEVDRVTLNGFTFIVRKRSEKVVRIPATFKNSEIILAFLKRAAVNK